MEPEPVFRHICPMFEVITCFCGQKVVEESKQTDLFQERRLMIDGIKIDIRLIPFLELRICLLLLRLVLFKIIRWFSSLILKTSCFWISLSSPLKRFTMHSFRNWMKSLRQYLRKVISKLWEYFWNAIRVERCCVLNVQKCNLLPARLQNLIWGRKNKNGVEPLLVQYLRESTVFGVKSINKWA